MNAILTGIVVIAYGGLIWAARQSAKDDENFREDEKALHIRHLEHVNRKGGHKNGSNH